MRYHVSLTDQDYAVEVTPPGRQNGRGWQCRLEGSDTPVDAVFVADGTLSLIVDGRPHEATRRRVSGGFEIVVDGERYTAEVRDPRSLRGKRRATSSAAGQQRLVASMPGKVLRVVAPPGTRVDAGDGILVVEAMKMQNELKSPVKGVVKQVVVSEGSAVNAGDVLAVIEAD